MAKLLRNIFLVFVLVAVFAVSIQAQGKRCPRNQEWNSCGTACPSRCGQPEPKVCTYQCIIGCQCKNGYKLNSNGQCVLPRDC